MLRNEFKKQKLLFTDRFKTKILHELFDHLATHRIFDKLFATYGSKNVDSSYNRVPELRYRRLSSRPSIGKNQKFYEISKTISWRDPPGDWLNNRPAAAEVFRSIWPPPRTGALWTME